MRAKEFKVIWSDRNGAVRNRPSRNIAVQDDATLYDLAAAVLGSFDFDMDHAFGFYDNLKNWARSQTGYELFADMGEKGRFAGVKRVRISKVFHTPKQKMLLLFDYGDEWHFVVQYIKEIDVPAGGKPPIVLSSKGEAPSQYGYEEEEYDEEE